MSRSHRKTPICGIASTVSEKSDKAVLCAAPILVQGDVEGGVCLLGGLPAPAPGAEQSRAAGIAAAFFARWMAE